ncbi:MAG: glycosyltransferase [Casimicrobiaceae bacterium]
MEPSGEQRDAAAPGDDSGDASGPLVSVVLPTYNRARLLERAIPSILEQTYRRLELIVVDDNSSDDTGAVVRAFTDPRVHYVRNEQNLKLPRGLNKGFSLSRGTYLTWTSDDNLYGRDAIGRMVAFLQSGRAEFVFADYYHFTDLDPASGEPVEARHVRLPDVLHLEQGNSVGACFMYTREVYEKIGGYDPELFLVEDYDYFIRIQKQFRIGHIAEPLYYFRRHDESLFCARFAEVKASDVLVRYKNALIDEEGAANACVELVMRDLTSLRSPMLRSGYHALQRVSFRLTKAYAAGVRRYVAWQMKPRVADVLQGFRTSALTFRQARDALREVMQGIGALEYR